MRFLVTGGSGFIGHHLVADLLRRGHDVRNIDKHTYAAADGSRDQVFARYPPEQYWLYQEDLADNDRLLRLVLRQFKPQYIIHAAAESHVDRSIEDASVFLRSNVLGTHNLLEAARELKELEKFCYVSTDEVYGPTPGPDEDSEDIRTEGFRETAPLRPRNPYAASKAAAEHLCLAYHHTHRLPVVVTRGSNTYGSFQLPEKFLPMMITRAARSQRLPVYGDGRQTREWMHVEDHVAGILAACDRGRSGEVYNLGTSQRLANLDLAREVLRHMRKDAALISHVEDRPGHDRDYAVCVDKARRELGWRAKRRLLPGDDQTDSGLAELIDWCATTGRRWLEEHGGAHLERRGLTK